MNMNTANERVEASIIAQIQTGKLKPGDHIAHLKLARQMKVSNNPVIQALRKLEGQGLLERTPDGMAMVRNFSTRDIYAALVLREAIEGVAARFCAEYATDEEMAVLKLRYSKMIAAYQKSDYEPGLEEVFHKSIVDFCHTPFLAHLYDTIAMIKKTFTLRAGKRKPDELIALHEKIFAAIERRDAAAAEEAARRHVADARELYLNSVRKEAAPRRKL